MCDALGTIIVDHLSKGELKGAPLRMVGSIEMFIIELNEKLVILHFQEEGEPHELLELRQEKE